jgi:hypothetical protein
MQACQTRITQEIKRLGNAHGPLTQPLKTNHHKTNQAKTTNQPMLKADCSMGTKISNTHLPSNTFISSNKVNMQDECMKHLNALEKA